MVLIISSSSGTVNTVIDWIISKGVIVHRINSSLDNIRLSEIFITRDKSDIEITFENYNITTKLSDYTGIWIWHGDVKFSNCGDVLIDSETNPLIEIIKSSLEKHHKVLIHYFNIFLTDHTKKTIGNVSLQTLNKLDVLLKARRIGIEIPETYITSTKMNLLRLKEIHPLITKPYHEVVYPIYNDRPFQNYTSSVNDDLILDLREEEIFPTLVQEKIEKLFEIRSFFLKGKFFSMAIFSQASLQTQLDFRDYDIEKPNRTIPFQIPPKIEKKLARLFKSLNLNSGSVDMIYTNGNQFKFLEINPVGQFGMVSFPCNYYLEELLTQELIHE